MRRFEPELTWLGALGVGLAMAPALADPSYPQPTMPPASPVVQRLVEPGLPPLHVHQRGLHRLETPYRVVRHHVPHDLARPALAGVTLVTPLEPVVQPPDLAVPMPAYPLDSVASALMTPAPPIVCHHVRRDPDAPDPHLYREAAVGCEPDRP